MDTVPDQNFSSSQLSEDELPVSAKRKPRLWGRTLLVIRRIHLYAGLFLLPWVFLYGITGAMFNHQELFPAASFQRFKAELLADSPMSEFPSPEQLARQVVAGIQVSAGEAKITLAEEHGAEFTNNMMFEANEAGTRYIVHIDPVSQSSKLITRDKNEHQPEEMLTDIHNIKLASDPQVAAQQSAEAVLNAAGIETNQTLKPLGWTKLNFLAQVNGNPARVTYVLKDGHVDVTKYEAHHGMSLRNFLLRLHISHGQSPHWNGRMLWTFALDAMAIAMVVWGLSGLLMWWQIKRTRVIGSLVIGLSVITAVAVYFSMHDFYATTKL